jgi:hypothetical protein
VLLQQEGGMAPSQDANRLDRPRQFAPLRIPSSSVVSHLQPVNGGLSSPGGDGFKADTRHAGKASFEHLMQDELGIHTRGQYRKVRRIAACVLYACHMLMVASARPAATCSMLAEASLGPDAGAWHPHARPMPNGVPLLHTIIANMQLKEHLVLCTRQQGQAAAAAVLSHS